MSSKLLDVYLLTCISFHYVESRLGYLREVLSQQPALAGRTDTRIFTNTQKIEELESIKACFPPSTGRSSFSVIPVSGLPHPYFLTWAHKQALSNDFLADPDYTHFMYIEDDLLVRPENLAYWLSARAALRPYGLIPSFFRVEQKATDNVWRSTDLTRRIKPYGIPKVRLSNDRWYINLKNPYQAMYLFDRELALEHLAGPARNPDFQQWGIREQAAQGQTFVAIPEGFSSRNVVPFDPLRLVLDSSCWVHHLPNTYANDPASPFGKLAMDSLVTSPRFFKLFASLR